MTFMWGVAAIALAALVGMGGIVILIGWASLRERELDDPEHPYLPPPDHPKRRRWWRK